MPKNIKITEKQYQRIQEEIDNDFIYFTNNDTKPYDGQVNISANGKIDGETNAKPTSGDKVQQSLTPQGYGRYRCYGNISPRTMREGVAVDQSNDFYDMKGFNNTELNMLTNDNDKDNLIKIPQSIERKLDILLDSIKQSNLTPKQQAIILNKILEELDYDNIPNQWKKELINDLK